jgi:hypothetical protein
LVIGPQDVTDLVEFGVSLMPDCPRTEMLEVLNDLRNQYLENSQRIITPYWWKDGPEKFRNKMNDELSLMFAKKDMTEETRQLRVLEALLNMWMEFLGSGE